MIVESIWDILIFFMVMGLSFLTVAIPICLIILFSKADHEEPW